MSVPRSMNAKTRVIQNTVLTATMKAAPPALTIACPKASWLISEAPNETAAMIGTRTATRVVTSRFQAGKTAGPMRYCGRSA